MKKKLLLILLVIASALHCYKVVYKVPGEDFNVFYMAWELFVTGNAQLLYKDNGLDPDFKLPENLKSASHHRAGPYLYPTTFAMMFAPMGLLPHNVAEILWYYFNLIAIVLAFLMVRKFLPEMPWHYYLVLFLITGRFFFRSLEYGQINTLIMTGIVSVFYFYSRGMLRTAAFILALISSWKISPVIMLIYFVWKREYKFVYRSVGYICLLLVLPSVFYGLKTNAQLLFECAQQLRIFGTKYDSSNQAISAMIQRFFTDTDFKVFSGDIGINVSIANFSPQLKKMILTVFQIAIIVGTYFCVRKSKTETDLQNKDNTLDKVKTIQQKITLFEAALMTLAMLLLTHLMWTATLVHLFLPHAVLLYLIYTKKTTKVFSALFILTIVLNTFSAPGFLGQNVAEWTKALSFMTFAELILFGLLVKVIY